MNVTAQAGDTLNSTPFAQPQKVVPMPTKSALRQQLRTARKQLAPHHRARAARAVARHALRLLRGAQRVGVYLSAGSELGTAPLIKSLQQRGLAVYAPRLALGQRLRWLRLHRHTPCPRHAKGMRQPYNRLALPARRLQLLFVPLLGFTASGQRLGQGGGYYDRALARLHSPRLIGLAYACQQCAALPSEAHDIPLHTILTELGPLPCAIG